MANLHRQISFRVNEVLYHRIHTLAEQNSFRVGKFLNQLIEKSLDLLEVAHPFLLPIPCETDFLPEVDSGKAYVLKHVEFEIGAI